MPYNNREVDTRSLDAGRYYFQSIGSVEFQILTSTSLNFTVEVTNRSPGVVFSDIGYGLNGASRDPGVACTPSAEDIVSVVAGNMNFVVLNVASGSGTVEATTDPGFKAIS